MALPWTQKYAPTSLKELIGQADALAQLHAYLQKPRRGRALWLFGPQGSGKTSAVHAAARDLGLELLEVNASDVRNKDAIETLLGQNAKQASLFGRRKVILVDEADGISGNADRGGVAALVELIRESRVPLVLTGNDPTDRKFSALRKVCTLVKFAPLDYAGIAQRLRAVLNAEHIAFEEEALKALARRAGGDLRGALNDAQGLSNGITARTLEGLSARDLTDTMGGALLRVFKTTQASNALEAFDRLSEDLDDVFLWMEENVPREYTRTPDLARAMEALADADVFRGRIQNWQYWRLQVYAYGLLSAGVALAKDAKYPAPPEYAPTTRLLKFWMANQKNLRRKAVAAKLAAATHTSARRALVSLAYLQRPLSKSKALQEELRLDEEELAWLTKKS